MYAKKTILSVTCLMMSAGLISTSHAATDVTGSLNTKLTIGAGCQLASGNNSVLDFGVLANPKFSAKAQTAAGSGIIVKCSNGIPYKIGLDGGLNGKTTDFGFDRYVIGPNSALMQYYLYKDAARQEEWQSIDSGDVATGTGNGTEQEFIVYGALLTSDATPSGDYTDTVKVTLRF